MLSTILLVVLILILIGALPTWGYSRGWGYGAGGLVGLLLIIVVMLGAFHPSAIASRTLLRCIDART
jgi:Protein of unknown function (DUF3309)